jgi:hypothetical protein
MQKIIIVDSRNTPPEEEVEERLEELGDGWRVVSAITSLYPFGEMDDGPRHIYYVTTVVVGKPN